MKRNKVKLIEIMDLHVKNKDGVRTNIQFANFTNTI